MTGLTCDQARDAAAEYALDILESGPRSELAAHLLRCPACRAEVEALSGVATRLIELVPGTEPPLGFDRRVMARVQNIKPSLRSGRISRLQVRRPRLATGIAALVAAAAIVFGPIGWFMGHSSHSSSPRRLTDAAFQQGSRNVGELDAYGDHPMWLTMTVHGVQGGPRVTCELVATGGKITPLGSFDLVDGSGSWGAPDPAGLAGVTGARLVDGNGHVLATATFPVA
jgi:hypothetical protein